MADVSVHRTARDIAREEITRAIVAEGRRQLTEVGPSELSLRAVARELGMVSSAVYRYVRSRDDLLTALIIEIYTELGEALAEADRSVTDWTRFSARWMAIAERLHRWAVEHPFDYALVYGSPVHGYRAPRDTVAPAGRVTGVLLGLLAEVQAAGRSPEPRVVPRPVHRAIAGLRDVTDHSIDDDLLLRGVQAWAGLLGAINLQLFGHLHRGVDDYDAWFRDTAARLCPV
ncbi:TetR family transcriptional regulator [Tersicoccus solisilvae]|uniref:TetR family transcriptional regulator n=1 Tax=Tersicoccus solisilvae TaxID=1882339 RepID=A0ABQ1P5I0_9MICC|nr:TetR-like C-terminal domain-containing protein [Tersicoccus solisilvae]GGC91178.1 TetR family transcriptional regulator [Tersicoccus solisilvae]